MREVPSACCGAQQLGEARSLSLRFLIWEEEPVTSFLTGGGEGKRNQCSGGTEVEAWQGGSARGIMAVFSHVLPVGGEARMGFREGDGPWAES